MKKLKKDYYNEDLRVYKTDEEGNEWFFYKDKETNLILRAATETEADLKKILTVASFIEKDSLKREILSINRSPMTNSDHDIWIVENRVGKVIAGADVYYNTLGGMEISYYFKNDTMLISYEQMLKKALKNLGAFMQSQDIDHVTSKIIEKLYKVD